MENVDAGPFDPEDSPEKLFVFHEYTPTLRNVASHKLAWKLCSDYISHLSSRKKRKEMRDILHAGTEAYNNYVLELNELVKSFKTPRQLEAMLLESLTQIRREMKNWMNHFEVNIFRSEWKKYCPRYFDPNLIVWHQNSEINRKRSAFKMVYEGELDRAQRFIIMCSHGMEYEIEDFPVYSLPRDVMYSSFFEYDVRYWIYRLTGGNCDALQKFCSALRGAHMSIDRIMVKLCTITKIPCAFEYFWNRLNEDEQISEAIEDFPKSWEFQKIILSTLSSYQQRQLVDEIGVQLMKNFCNDFDMPEKAFTIWNLLRDRITPEEFAELITGVFHRSMCSEECMVMLNNIWDTASDRLKRYVADYNAEFIFVSFGYHEHSPSSYKFLIKYMSMVEKSIRKQLIFAEDADDLIESVDDLDIMMNIMNVCIPEKADQLEFQENTIKSQAMEACCAKLLNSLEFEQVIDKIMFYSPSLGLTQEFVKNLLRSDFLRKEIFILDHEKWNNFSMIIDKAFPDDSQASSKLKKELITSFSTDAVHYWNKSENFNGLVKVAEQVFSSDEIDVFKKTLFKHFREMISSKQFWQRFEGKCFNTFISWCLTDENKVIDFKKIIPVDALFDDTFCNICAWYVLNRETYEPLYLLNELDKLLGYFYVSEEEIKMFKIQKFKAYDQYWLREVWLNSEDRAWMKILSWFFENDQDQVEMFLGEESAEWGVSKLIKRWSDSISALDAE